MICPFSVFHGAAMDIGALVPTTSVNDLHANQPLVDPLHDVWGPHLSRRANAEHVCFPEDVLAAAELPSGAEPIERGSSSYGGAGGGAWPQPPALASALAELDQAAAAGHSAPHLCYSALQILRTRLGVERAAIYLYRDSMLTGTFGTDRYGRTTDERHVVYAAGRLEQHAHQQFFAGAGAYFVATDAPLVEHSAFGSSVFRHGWVAMTPLVSGPNPVGLIYNDSALTGAAVDGAQQHALALFASRLAVYLSRYSIGYLGANERHGGAPLESPPTEAFPGSGSAAYAAYGAMDSERHYPGYAHSALETHSHSEMPGLRRADASGSGAAAVWETLSQRTELHEAVRTVMHTLREEPRLTGGALSRRVGLSDGHLARLFKTEAGMSMVEYRNRLRLDRFFSAIDDAGSNLLEASRDAGFGSYAQFHRVFRRLVGMAPRDYVMRLRTRQPSGSAFSGTVPR